MSDYELLDEAIVLLETPHLVWSADFEAICNHLYALLVSERKSLAPHEATFDLANSHARDLPRFWIGSRPMLPDGLPVIGSLSQHASQSGLWINSGHGSTGWAMAAGSAYLLADLILGALPSCDSLAVSRLPSKAIGSASLEARSNRLGARPSAYPIDTMDFSPLRWCRRAQN